MQPSLTSTFGLKEKQHRMQPTKYRRPWPFIATDPRYIYPLALFILVAGCVAAYYFNDPSFVSRSGNFIIGAGVWMSLRYTLREGVNRVKSRPLVPRSSGPMKEIDSHLINQSILAIGDADLQVRGFVLVMLGSLVGSFGDLAFSALVLLSK